jgi:hypothetical protein
LRQKEINWSHFQLAFKQGEGRVLLELGPGPPCVISVMAANRVRLVIVYQQSSSSYNLAAEQFLAGQAVRSVRAGGMPHPSQCKSHLPGHYPPATLGRTLC